MAGKSAGQPASPIVNLARRILRPIIGILLRNGLHFGDFAAIARSLYVEVSADEFGIKGRRTNTSRIAMMTGLSRTQAKRELDMLDGHPDDGSNAPLDHVRHASRLLLGWHLDSRFASADAEPRPLDLDGPGDTFETLYEVYSGKAVPATSMLKELIAVGAVEKLDNGKIVARARSYVPSATDPAALFRVGLAISDLATSANHNLYNSAKQRARFERFATNQLIPKKHVRAFQDYLAIEGQAFLERADDWLSEKESQADDEDVVRIGVGVYQVLTPPIKTDEQN